MKKISICLFIILGMCAACNLQAQDNATPAEPVAPAVNNVEDDTPVAKSPTKSWSPTAAMLKNKYLQATNAPVTQYRLDQLEEEVKDIDNKIHQEIEDKWGCLSNDSHFIIQLMGIMITLIGIAGPIAVFIIFNKNNEKLKQFREDTNRIKDDANRIREDANRIKEETSQLLEKAKNAITRADKADEELKQFKEDANRIKEETRQLLEKAENTITKAEEATQKAEAASVRAEKADVDSKESAKQAEISQLFTEALQSHERKDYKKACELYKKIIGLEPNNATAYYNWGCALGGLKNHEQACEKYEEAIKIKPDYLDAYNNWGIALLLSKKPDEALPILQKAEEIKTGSGNYNIACCYGLKGDKEQCKEWLLKASKLGILPTFEHAKNDEDLAIVRDEDWFKGLGWASEPRP